MMIIAIDRNRSGEIRMMPNVFSSICLTELNDFFLKYIKKELNEFFLKIHLKQSMLILYLTYIFYIFPHIKWTITTYFSSFLLTIFWYMFAIIFNFLKTVGIQSLALSVHLATLVPFTITITSKLLVDK